MISIQLERNVYPTFGIKCSMKIPKLYCTLKMSGEYNILRSHLSVRSSKDKLLRGRVGSFLPKSDLSAFNPSGLKDFNWNHMHRILQRQIHTLQRMSESLDSPFRQFLEFLTVKCHEQYC